jgi:hypothetical protein
VCKRAAGGVFSFAQALRVTAALLHTLLRLAASALPRPRCCIPSQVTEVGTMNFFVLWRNAKTGRTELVTAPLTDGTILPGVTRQSILDLTRTWGEFDVVERKFTMAEVVGA